MLDDNATGTEIEGRPAKLAGIVITSFRYSYNETPWLLTTG